MDRIIGDARRRTRQSGEKQGASAVAAPRRIDRLAEIVDLCTDARRIAEGLDEKLLSYLLGMAIQETRAGMRQEVAVAAGIETAPVSPAAKPQAKPTGGRRR